MEKANFKERALYLISPEKGARAYRERVRKERLERQRDGLEIMEAATGYGNHGASKTLNSMVGWIVGGGAAEDDIDLQGATLRQRARDLYAGGGLAKSGPDTLTAATVAWGIMPSPKIDGEKLGLSDEKADQWERQTLREFRLWASSPQCDAERSKNFYALQKLAFLSMLMSGDVFALFGMKENKRTPYQTTIRLLEADRICTPDTDGDSDVKETESGGRIVDGVEISKDGEVIRYHIANRHPLRENDTENVSWTAIEAYGKDTGYPNILHITTFERPEQRRGTPFVAAQIEKIKQLDRYINSELAANVVSSMLTAFLVSDEDDGKAGLEDAVNEEDKVTDDDLQLELAPGAIYDLPPGKKVESVNPLRSNSGFESFVNAMWTEIGAGMKTPKEVLIKKYDSNYTAARAALLDYWRTVRTYRAEFVDSFCQPVYEAWLSEAVAIGRVEAPGFFEAPAIRQARCACSWKGASMGHVDPKKEAEAASMRISLNISTQEQEASEYNGNSWAENVRQRKKEAAAAAELRALDPNAGQITVRKDGEEET